MTQQVTEEFEVRVSIGRLGGISFNALFCGPPSIADVVAAINHKRKTAKIFKLAPPELFIDAVKRIGIPIPNHALYQTDGCCVHVITIDLFPVMSGAIPQPPKRSDAIAETCCLCNQRPEIRMNGDNGSMLFHACPADNGGKVWFETRTEWEQRNVTFRQRYGQQ